MNKHGKLRDRGAEISLTKLGKLKGKGEEKNYL